MATNRLTRLMLGRARSRKPRLGVPTRTRCRAEAPDASGRPAASAESLRQLIGFTLRLRGIYGTAVTAELALRQQCADEDPEIADCLSAGVCNPIAEQIRDLEDLAYRLRCEAPELNT